MVLGVTEVVEGVVRGPPFFAIAIWIESKNPEISKKIIVALQLDFSLEFQFSPTLHSLSMTPPIPFDFNNLRDEQDNSSSQSITPCPTQPTTETETRTQQESRSCIF